MRGLFFRPRNTRMKKAALVGAAFLLSLLPLREKGRG